MAYKRQSDALHLADIADDGAWTFVIGVRKEIAAELRRQYAEIETLRTGYEAARLEIASLQAQLEALASQAQPVGATPVATIEHTLGGSIQYAPLHDAAHRLPMGVVFSLYTAPQALDAWQPIESAPKDGTYILLGSADGSWIARNYPVYQSGYRPDNPWQSMMLNHEHMGRYPKAKPTHWMPLPPAPSTEGESNG